MKNDRKTFAQIMDRLCIRHGAYSVFSDFLSMCICAFSHGAMEEEYLNIVRKYHKPEAYALSEALGALVIEMTGDGDGMIDVLGQYFEENMSHGKNGQFFTPQPICDMMARMNNPVGAGERVLDPACGSGRMLMGYAKVNRFAKFYGADNDQICAKMTVINLFLNTLFGEVAWMNSLTNQYFGGWVIEPTLKGVQRIRVISEKQSLIHLKLPEEIKKTETAVSKIEIPVSEVGMKPPEQGLLFEF